MHRNVGSDKLKFKISHSRDADEILRHQDNQLTIEIRLFIISRVLKFSIDRHLLLLIKYDWAQDSNEFMYFFQELKHYLEKCIVKVSIL